MKINDIWEYFQTSDETTDCLAKHLLEQDRTPRGSRVLKLANEGLVHCCRGFRGSLTKKQLIKGKYINGKKIKIPINTHGKIWPAIMTKSSGEIAVHNARAVQRIPNNDDKHHWFKEHLFRGLWARWESRWCTRTPGAHKRGKRPRWAIKHSSNGLSNITTKMLVPVHYFWCGKETYDEVLDLAAWRLNILCWPFESQWREPATII